jgi:hypothetical protein
MSLASNFDQKLTDPVVQAATVSAAAAVIMLGGWALTASGIYRLEPLFAWSIAAAFSLLFALVNSLLSLRADSFAKYWGRSVYSYMGSALVMGLVAWGLSGIPLREAGTYRMVYIAVSFGFLVFLSMVNLMKKIVQFAEREEWNQPRKR